MINISTTTMCSSYPLRLLEDQLEPNTPGFHWVKMKHHVMGMTDMRARSGTFTTPWNAISPFRQPLPDLTIPETRGFSELADLRGQEIYANACRSNKRIVVMWSGGIDSTVVLVSLLKTIPQNEYQDRLVVCMTTDSVLENFTFYKNFISTKIPTVHVSSIEFNNDFLNQNILLHGDPGDALFGSGSRKFQPLIAQDQYLLPYKDNMDLLYSCAVNQPSAWKAVVDKLTANLEESPLDQIVTIADWFWWQYINFKWEGSLWRPFHGAGLRKDHSTAISRENSLDYLKNTYFNTDYFQRWSYTNIHNFYPGGMRGHKHAPKKYIFEFDHNEVFNKNKLKMPSLPLDMLNGVEHNLWERPAFYDENWVGYTLQDPEVYKMALELLGKYNG